MTTTEHDDALARMGAGAFFDPQIGNYGLSLGEWLGKRCPSTVVEIDVVNPSGIHLVVTITREELGALYHAANEDWAMMVKHTGDLREPDTAAREAWRLRKQEQR